MRMINHDTVEFRSLYRWFALEQDGRKPNTVRLLSRAEYDVLNRTKPSRVSIVCEDRSGFFERDITWSGKIDDVLGQVLYMVCWETP